MGKVADESSLLHRPERETSRTRAAAVASATRDALKKPFEDERKVDEDGNVAPWEDLEALEGESDWKASEKQTEEGGQVSPLGFEPRSLHVPAD